MITAKFGTKNFEVSNKKIYTPNGVSISEELNIEETEVSGKKPTIGVKGIKLKTISFDLKLDSRFVDVDTEMSFWEKTLKAKTSQTFKLGNVSFGKFFLVKYDVKNITLSKSGEYTSALISLSFTEDGKATNSANSTTKKATTVKASASSSATTIKKGTTIKPKKNVRWYKTAEQALKKKGTSGLAYQKNMVVTYTYSKSGKIVCVNPQGLGWLKIEDVTFVSAPKAGTATSKTNIISSTKAHYTK